MQSLEHGHVIALPCQVAGAGQTSRAGTHDSHPMPIGDRLLRRGGSMGVMPVSHKALQTANTHRIALLAPDAVFLALALLGAYPAADGRQGGGIGDNLIGFLELPGGHLLDKLGNVDHHGTALHTRLVLAVQAALGFIQSLLLSVA